MFAHNVLCVQERLSESRDDDVTRLESRLAELEAECQGHVAKMAAAGDERHSLTNQLRELSRRQRQVSCDWLSASREQLLMKLSIIQLCCIR